MRFSTVIAGTAVMLAGCLLVAATPVTTDLVVARAPTRSIVSTTRYIYDRNGTKIATVKDGVASGNVDVATLESLLNPEIVTKAFDAAVSITQAVCGSGNALACGVVGTVAVFGVFFTAWLSRRDLDGPLIDVNTEYPAISGCGTACRLKFEAEEGPWRSIGNVTVNGIFHDLHYQRNGSFSGLRSIQHGPVDQMSKRQGLHNGEDNNDGGMVVDYYFVDENESAYDSFGPTSTLIQSFADDAIDSMQSSNTVIECADFEDSDGLLNGGLLTVGWNGQAYKLDQPGESQALTDQCYSDTIPVRALGGAQKNEESLCALYQGRSRLIRRMDATSDLAGRSTH
ncbi:hypothetical protein B0H21DRAFT_883369 [Amylocystis lapponica]|nr:hypothetical protein B0H21DRAFT_883369 [Amylocystis lapponica]